MHQEVKTVEVFEEKVVAIEQRDVEVKEVVVYKDKIVEKDNMIVKTDINNVIETKLQTVDLFQEKVVPVMSSTEKIVEVPYLLEKIVEKIVIMPQVVEVIKYVHEILEEETLGVAVGVGVQEQEVKYKELYANIRVHFEGVLVELRKLKTQTPGLKVQIEVIETFLAELDRLIKFPRIVEVEKEKKVEVEVAKPVLVPTKDAESIRSELALSVLAEKLIGEIKSIKSKNPSLQLGLDEDLQLIFFSEAFGGGNLNEDLKSQLRSYKESQHNKLMSLGKNWTGDHDMIINTILEERFTMANTLKHTNLEIEKAKALAEQRGEAYRALRKSFTLFQTKVENFERELGIVTKNFENNPSVSNELRRLFGAVEDLRGSLTIDVKTLRPDDKMYELGDIHGSGEGYFRLQSAFRTLEQENAILRDKYVKWQKEIPNASVLADKERIIENFSRQIASMTSEISSLKSQPSAAVEVRGNTSEYEIKIRTLNSRIQELESQLRTQKVDYEGQIRNKNQLIRELEDKLAATGKVDESRATNLPSDSNIDRMGSSQTSS